MKSIVAVDKCWGIGKNNDLLFSIPADMKFFRETTMGKVVVMGRKTLESFPGGQPLKKRTNIVLTREEGENLGSYKFITATSQNQNYNIPNTLLFYQPLQYI